MSSRSGTGKQRMLSKIDQMLVDAATDGDNSKVQKALSKGADIHADDDEALRRAAQAGHAETVRLLLDSGADIHSKNDWALRWSANGGHKETVKLLLDRGADIHAGGDEALLLAAQEGRYATIDLLLKHGADIHAENDGALCKAVEQGYDYIVLLLLDHGADLHVGGDLLLNLAITHGKKETALLLLRRGADSKVSDPVSAEELRVWLRTLKSETAQKFETGDWQQQCFSEVDKGKRVVHEDILDACITGQFASLVGAPLIASTDKADRELFQNIWDALPKEWQDRHQSLYMEFAKAGGLQPVVGFHTMAVQRDAGMAVRAAGGGHGY